MALADPQSIQFGAAAAILLPRVTTLPNGSVYSSADGTVDVTVSQSAKGRKRTLFKSSRKKISTNVLNDLKSEIGASVNISIDRPGVGFSETELLEHVKATFTMLTASTDANLKKILGMES